MHKWGDELMDGIAKNILIVDQQTMMCELVSEFLKAQGFYNATWANTVEMAHEQLREHGSYDIMLIDHDTPETDGLIGIEKFIKANQPDYVAFFSNSYHPEIVMRGIELGARGFVPKTLRVKSLLNALNFISAGETYLPSHLMPTIAKPRRVREETGLSEAEIQVIRGIIRGQINKEIGRDLGITENAVKMIVRTLCRKLGVSNRTQIAMKGIEKSLC